METKLCYTCDKWLELEAFRPMSNGNLPSDCKKCVYETNKDQIYRNRLRRSFQLTVEQYDEMFAAQEGLCLICQKPERAKTKAGAIKRLAIDHDHKCCPTDKTCGKCIRGLLCQGCNTAIGMLGEDEEVYKRAFKHIHGP